MEININLDNVIKAPEFTQTIAEYIAGKYHSELFSDWREQFMKDFVKQLEAQVRDSVVEYINDEKGQIRSSIANALNKLTKEEIIDLVKSGNFPF